MKLFVYEYICGGGLAGRPLPESLAREGWAMLASIVEDFARVEGCEIVSTLDERLADRPLPARHVEKLGEGRDGEQRVIERFASQCDWTLIIAPEFERILADRVQWAEHAGGRLLGSSSQGVANAADKLVCARLLNAAGISAVAGQRIRIDELNRLAMPVEPPVVLKPRDGAGAQHIFLIPDAHAVDRVRHEAMAEGFCGEALLEPFIPGLAASVSLLVGPVGVMPLLAGEQLLSCDGRFRYLGGRLPLPTNLSNRAIRLATRAAAAIPGLRGFVGVDLVLDPQAVAERNDTSFQDAQPVGDFVVEINPRLTTSYVGLRSLAIDSIAERMIGIIAEERTEPIAWRNATIGFAADGRLT